MNDGILKRQYEQGGPDSLSKLARNAQDLPEAQGRLRSS
jgi:hypothetical protein